MALEPAQILKLPPDDVYKLLRRRVTTLAKMKQMYLRLPGLSAFTRDAGTIPSNARKMDWIAVIMRWRLSYRPENEQ